jgi:hypothetical protein
MHGEKSASFSGDLERLFSTPSLMRGEDPKSMPNFTRGLMRWWSQRMSGTK